MAFHKLYCTSCGLEIYPDESFRRVGNDLYHDHPYQCNPHPPEDEDWGACP